MSDWAGENLRVQKLAGKPDSPKAYYKDLVVEVGPGVANTGSLVGDASFQAVPILLSSPP